MEQSTIALYLAIYGAVLSTIVMIWNIRRDVNDRAEIKVNAKPVKRWFMDDAYAEYISVELANTGKRPISILEIYYKIGKEIILAQLSKSQDLPKELGEGQFFSTDIMKEDIVDLGKVEFFIAKDSRGITYKSKRYPLKSTDDGKEKK